MRHNKKKQPKRNLYAIALSLLQENVTMSKTYARTKQMKKNED